MANERPVRVDRRPTSSIGAGRHGVHRECATGSGAGLRRLGADLGPIDDRVLAGTYSLDLAANAITGPQERQGRYAMRVPQLGDAAGDAEPLGTSDGLALVSGEPDAPGLGDGWQSFSGFVVSAYRA